MGKILKAEEITSVKKNKKPNDTIVLVGGCFDILHSGHLYFLKQAKKQGTSLVLLLAGDEYIRKLKGKDRPINTQSVRANILSSVLSVDYVILLDNIKSDYDWPHLVKMIQPDIIAVTDQDQVFAWENDYIIKVIKRVSKVSTTNIFGGIKI